MTDGNEPSPAPTPGAPPEVQRTPSGRTARPKYAQAPGAAPFGMAVFLVSLGVLFIASLVAYAAIRIPATDWPPPGTPPLPKSMWLATALLLVSSGTIHHALRGVRHGDPRALRRGLVATLLLGLAFLAVQLHGWWALVQLDMPVSKNLYAFTFYLLTALHGAHVIGGLAPLGLVSQRAFAGRYAPDAHMGVTLVTMYWHFLDAVWVVIFTVLVLVG